MSDSPLPVPSGYICHTSCAVGKGRQPQQHDCPSSHPPYTATPNFTPESQYLLITLEGIVLYSPLSLSPSPASFPLLLSLQHDLCTFFCGQPFSPLFFFPPSHVPPYFSRKRETRTGWFFAPVALSSRRSQLFFAILLVLSFRG